ARIKPPAGSPPTDPTKRPFVVIDPRAGHGPGIGGFKMDSEVGIALSTAHPCYFVMFFPQPVPGQTIESVWAAEIAFLRKVNELYNLYSKVDTERSRFLQFEKWWGGHFLMNKEEMAWIARNLFVGNKLSAGEIESADGRTRVDIRNIREPIIVFASWGDNITPSQQALNWIPDVYASVDEIRANEQTIVYSLHKKIGHLGIFVSAGVVRRETAELASALDL